MLEARVWQFLYCIKKFLFKSSLSLMQINNLTNRQFCGILFKEFLDAIGIALNTEFIIQNGISKFGDRMVHRGSSWYKQKERM